MENVIELVKCPLCGAYVPAREYAVIRRKANQRVCVYCLNGDHEVPGQFDCTCKCHGNGRTT